MRRWRGQGASAPTPAGHAYRQRLLRRRRSPPKNGGRANNPLPLAGDEGPLVPGGFIRCRIIYNLLNCLASVFSARLALKDFDCEALFSHSLALVVVASIVYVVRFDGVTCKWLFYLVNNRSERQVDKKRYRKHYI